MSDPDRSLEAATAAVRSLRGDLTGGLGTERVPLDRLAGRTLATAVTADRDVPPRSQATMDGFAVAAGDDPPLALGDDRTGPGDDPSQLPSGGARRVATGGPLPDGADAVVPVEEAAVSDGRVDGFDADRGQYVLARGSVVAAGETVLAAGRSLAPRDAATLSDLGHETVPVRRRLSTAVLATGTEIHQGREPDRDSETVASLVRAWGGDPALAGSVPDDPERVRDRISSLAVDHDVVVSTGGTGASGADETGDALGRNAEVRVADVAMRPGSNVTVARLPDERAVVAALPGPPGAAFASATLLLRPLFVGATRHPTVAATMARDLPVPDRPVEYVVPVEIRADPDSPDRPSAMPFGHRDSSVHLYDDRYRPHRVAACARLSAADGFVRTAGDRRAGESVAVAPYPVVET